MKRRTRSWGQVPQWQHEGACYIGKEGPYLGRYWNNREQDSNGRTRTVWYYQLEKWGCSGKKATAGSRSIAMICVEEQIEPAAE